MGSNISKREEELRSAERSYQQYDDDNEDTNLTNHPSIDRSVNIDQESSTITKQSRSSTLVVVKSKPKEEIINFQLDPLFQRMEAIPMFLPIIDKHGRNNFPWPLKGSTQNLSSKLNCKPAINIGKLYNGYLRKNTHIISKNQNQLSNKIKQVDDNINKLMKTFTVRQKQYAQHAHKFGQITEMHRSLANCHKIINDIFNTAQILTKMLPEESREEFQWPFHYDDHAHRNSEEKIPTYVLS